MAKRHRKQGERTAESVTAPGGTDLRDRDEGHHRIPPQETGSPSFDANQVTKRDIEYEATPESEEPAASGPDREHRDPPGGPDRANRQAGISDPSPLRAAPGGEDDEEEASPRPVPQRRHSEPTD